MIWWKVTVFNMNADILKEYELFDTTEDNVHDFVVKNIKERYNKDPNELIIRIWERDLQTRGF